MAQNVCGGGIGESHITQADLRFTTQELKEDLQLLTLYFSHFTWPPEVFHFYIWFVVTNKSESRFFFFFTVF